MTLAHLTTPSPLPSPAIEPIAQTHKRLRDAAPDTRFCEPRTPLHHVGAYDSRRHRLEFPIWVSESEQGDQHPGRWMRRSNRTSSRHTVFTPRRALTIAVLPAHTSLAEWCQAIGSPHHDIWNVWLAEACRKEGYDGLVENRAPDLFLAYPGTRLNVQRASVALKPTAESATA